MGLLGRLQAKVTALAGSSPQLVEPQGWAIGGAGVSYKLNTQVYSASITPDLASGNLLFITATSNLGAWVLNAPLWNGVALSATNCPFGMPIQVVILNSSGGAIGAFSQQNPPWRGVTGFGAPGNGQYISVNFLVKSATEIIGVGPWMGATAY
jgi:hypothetical protein